MILAKAPALLVVAVQIPKHQAERAVGVGIPALERGRDALPDRVRTGGIHPRLLCLSEATAQRRDGDPHRDMDAYSSPARHLGLHHRFKARVVTAGDPDAAVREYAAAYPNRATAAPSALFAKTGIIARR